MKLTLQQISEGQEEVIVCYYERNEEIESLIRRIEQKNDKLLGVVEDRKILIAPGDGLYLESVDNIVYVYTQKIVGKTGLTLSLAESLYENDGFFRCSKSMVINIYHIEYLKSIAGNRVDVTMDNGEHVVISRRYVKALRSILKGERQ